jgi:hypothetical protein
MRLRILIAAVSVFFICAGDLFANIDNLSNMSAEWIRTGNRNAATDAADIVVYNPGGITELPDGFQVNIGNQTMIRKAHPQLQPLYGRPEKSQGFTRYARQRPWI